MITRKMVTHFSAPRYVIKLSEQLAKEHEVYVLSSEHSKLENVSVIHLPKTLAKRSVAPIAYSLAAKLVKQRKAIQIVHGQGYTFSDDVTTVHFLRRPFAYWSKEFGFETAGLSLDLETKFEERLFHSQKRLIAVSSLVKEDLMRYYKVDESKISIIHNGVDTEEFTPPAQETKATLRQKNGFSENDFYILFIGGPSCERKGFGFIVKALIDLPENVHLIVVGASFEKYRTLVSQLGLVNKVIFVPYIDDIREIYWISDVFVLPTIYDPFPLAALEAMASGLPVIVSSHAGTKDIISDGQNGLLLSNPSNVSELSAHLRTLIRSDKTRRTIAAEGRLIAEKLSWENMSKEVLRLYNDL
ncbi:MAG: glycosyltransferase family 4 protein [Candidatus Bathyarchaeia archaeon]|jgi:UDP-glucose:(heptosyl)LPS alpha-1,3-glucosyltransferase